MNKYYTVEEIAKILNMHHKTIQRYIREGKLKATKVGKSWRVTGHDLSVFMEGTNYVSDKTITQTAKELKVDKIKISAVVDIDVEDMDEGMRIVNMLTAVMNVKPPEYGHSTMNAQFIESGHKVRVMLWGNNKFMENMIGSLSLLTDQEL